MSGAFESLDAITIPVSEVTVQTHGEVGWSSARYRFQGEAGGETTTDEGDVTMVGALRDGGSYEATLFHASTLPDEMTAEGAS